MLKSIVYTGGTMSDPYEDTEFDEQAADDWEDPEDGRDGTPPEGSSDDPESMDRIDPLRQHTYLIDGEPVEDEDDGWETDPDNVGLDNGEDEELVEEDEDSDDDDEEDEDYDDEDEVDDWGDDEDDEEEFDEEEEDEDK